MFYLLIFLVVIFVSLTLLAYLGSNYLMARRQPDTPASPADFDLAFEEAEFRSGDGTLLRGWFIPARLAPATSTVILCPGVNGSIDADAAFLPWFHNLDLNVLIFDWRAHGRSEGQVVTLGYDERYDLLAAVEYAKARGAARIGVLGFSMGGAVALSTAAVSADIVAVAADSPFITCVTAVAAGLNERGVPETLAYAAARLILITASLRTGRNWFEAEPIRWVKRIAPRPLLLMFGDRDPFAPRGEVEWLNRLAGEPKDVWRVPEAAHRQLQALRPDEYRQIITAFFKQHLT